MVGKSRINNVPPWKRVSPVKTALPVLSSKYQQILSWVWQGVYSALTAISPRLKTSPFPGVRVTPSQSFPPIIDLRLNVAAYKQSNQRSSLNSREGRLYKFFISSCMISVARESQYDKQRR
jgi:hypothetical protein